MITDTELLKTIALILCPVLLAALTWFLRQSVNRSERTIEKLSRFIKDVEIDLVTIQKDVENLNKFIDSIATVTSDWALVKHQVKEISDDLKTMKLVAEDVALLKQSQKHVWSSIEELRKAGGAECL